MPERIQGAIVTPSLFPLLGVPPIKGRVFNDGEFGEGNDGVVMISERLGGGGGSIPIRSSSARSFPSTAAASPSSASCPRISVPAALFGVQGGTFAERADMWKPIAFTKQELETRGSRS